MVLSKLRKIELDVIVLLISIYAFLIPFNQKLTTVFLIIILIFSLITLKKQTIVINRFLLYPIALYFLLMLSFFWSSSIDYKYILRFSQLFFLPVLFSINGSILVGCNKKLILRAFIIGCVVSVLACEIYSTYRAAVFYPGGFYAVVQPGHTILQSMSDGGNLYFGKYFSVFHDSVYYATFLILALFTLAYLPFKNKKINVILVLILITGIFQISNRASFLILILLSLLYFLYKLKKKKSFKLKMLSFIGFSFFIFLILLNPRFNKMLNNIYNSGITVNPKATSTYEVRVLVWDAAVKLIKQSPVSGYGVNDHKSTLNNFYNENNYVVPYDVKLNSHNQYLTIMIEVGVVGLLIIIVMLYSVCINKNLTDFSLKRISQTFAVILIISFLFESMLQRYSGMLLFSFFYCLFISGPKPLSKKSFR